MTTKSVEYWAGLTPNDLEARNVTPSPGLTSPGLMHPAAVILHQASDLLGKKRDDYAPTNWAENFESSAAWMAKVCEGLPTDSPVRSAVVLMGVKISRLATLGLGRTASNESIDDTFHDLINYAALALALHHQEKKRASAEAEAQSGGIYTEGGR